MKIRVLIGSVLLLGASLVQADCGFENQICEKSCEVKFFGDNAAIAGCASKCVAERGVCLAKVGADKTQEVGEKAWQSTKSFFKGISD